MDGDQAQSLVKAWSGVSLEVSCSKFTSFSLPHSGLRSLFCFSESEDLGTSWDGGNMWKQHESSVLVHLSWTRLVDHRSTRSPKVRRWVLACSIAAVPLRLPAYLCIAFFAWIYLKAAVLLALKGARPEILRFPRRFCRFAALKR